MFGRRDMCKEICAKRLRDGVKITIKVLEDNLFIELSILI